MGFKSILKKISQFKLYRLIDTEVNGKVNNKLNKFIQPLNSAITVNREAIAEIKTILTSAVSENHNTHKLLADQQQGNMCHHALNLCLYPSFFTALKRIVGHEYEGLLRYAQLLFLEITKNYVGPGGIWKLEHEITFFQTPRVGPTRDRAKAMGSPSNHLKILIVSGMFPCIEHGGGLRLFDIISQLANGHDIDLFSVFNPALDQYSHDLLQGKLKETKLVSHHEFNEGTMLSWLAMLDREHGHYDVIQCEYPYSALYIDTLRPFGKKIGFTFMECVTKSALIKLQNSLAENDFVNLGRLSRSFWEVAVLELWAATKTDFQIAVTQEDAQFLEHMSGVTPDIIPTCLSPSQVISRIESCPDQDHEGKTVVFLGYFDHFPNIDGVKWYLANVHNEVKQKVQDYRFLVVGTGDISPLRKLSGSDPSVVYTGRVDDIMPYILRGKVCVLPLISGAGIRGKLNQYAIAGRPSVSTTIGNLGLDYVDGEAVLIADDPHDFAVAVIKLLTDDALNRSIGKQAKAFALAHFTWEGHIDRLIEIYRRVGL